MGISFEFIPTKRWRTLSGGMSKDAEVLVDLFGSFPIEFRRVHLPQLRAMAAAAGPEHVYASLVDALETHDEIEVKTSW